MNNGEKKYAPILGRGEKLITSQTKKSSGGPKRYPRTYQEARNLVQSEINNVKEEILKVPADMRMDDIVVVIKLHKDFLAKSYTPDTLFRQSGIENIGSKRWLQEIENKDETSKMHFGKMQDNSLDVLYEKLNEKESDLTKAFKEDIQKVEKITLLEKDEVIKSFDEDWDQGIVEFVLHPFDGQEDEVINKFKKILEGDGKSDLSTFKERIYPGGPIFISVKTTKKTVDNISNFNPLRTAHPMKMNKYPEMRLSPGFKHSLSPPEEGNVSRIKVGVFDGGVDPEHPLLKGYVNEGVPVQSPPHIDGIRHGTGVVGAILYGNISDYEPDTILETPAVAVESFRTLPLSENGDADMYEVIDFIEEVVAMRHDIHVYNISFGPPLAIEDDEISRFTYALDKLAYEHKKLFVVAVGNDGQVYAPYNRIQAPSDIVNGFGIGAHSYDTNGNIIKAPYSCVGDGREGCKVKPDLVAFGGDQLNPFHLLTPSDYEGKSFSQGTSFSSPLVASKAAEIMGRCDRFSALTARALLIHTATEMQNMDSNLGHGILNSDVDSILNSDENHVTIIYSSAINPGAYAKLPIPLPLNANITSNVSLSWTIATLSKVNPLHVEDYTESAIEDTFYPHDKKYKWSAPDNTVEGPKSKTMTLGKDDNAIAEIENQGWTRGGWPITATGEQSEHARRADLKWDTIVRKKTIKQVKSLENPFLILHGLGRHNSDNRIDYTVVITINAPRYEGNLYQEILNEYEVLEPISIRNRNEIMINL